MEELREMAAIASAEMNNGISAAEASVLLGSMKDVLMSKMQEGKVKTLTKAEAAAQ